MLARIARGQGYGGVGGDFSTYSKIIVKTQEEKNPLADKEQEFMSCSAAWNLEKISTWNKNVFKLPSVKDSNEKVIKDNVRHIFWSQKNFSKWESQVEVQRKWKEKEGKNSVWKRRGKARANWVSEYWDAVESITTHYYCHLWVFRILAEKNVWCDPHYNSHCVLYLFFCIKTDGKQGPEEKKLQKKWKMSLFAFHRGTTRSQKKKIKISWTQFQRKDWNI